jgi:hypothetical protein
MVEFAFQPWDRKKFQGGLLELNTTGIYRIHNPHANTWHQMAATPQSITTYKFLHRWKNLWGQTPILTHWCKFPYTTNSYLLGFAYNAENINIGKEVWKYLRDIQTGVITAY